MNQPSTVSALGEQRLVRTTNGSCVRAILHRSSTAVARKFLLIHGNPASLEDWNSLFPLLSPAGDVLTLDLPGFGQSTRPAGNSPTDLALPRLAEVVLEVANDFGWHEPFCVVGHSHGGGVAQVLASQHPERVSGLVLLGTLAFPAHLHYRILPLIGVRLIMRLGSALLRRPDFLWVKRGVARQVLSNLYAPQRPLASEVETELARVTRAPDSLVSSVDVSVGQPSLLLRQTAAKIQCKTLIIHGEQDRVVPLRCARALHAELSAAGNRAQLHVLPDAGHLLGVHQTEQCAQFILEFCASPATRLS